MSAILGATGGFGVALVLTAFGLGVRHGVDWDHLAAIGDLTSTGTGRRRSLVLATLYAVGHAVVIVILGSLAVLAGDYIPATLDSLMGRVVGVTLLALGGYVLYGLIRHGRSFRMRSRWSLLAASLRRLRRSRTVVIEHDHDHDHSGSHRHVHSVGTVDHVHHGDGGALAVTTKVHHSHRHVHVGSLPADPEGPGRRAAFGIGMLHGIGAETPTQVVLFVSAASAAGALAGELLLLSFTLGLLASNTAIAIAATAGFLHAERRFGIYAVMAGATAVFSIALGLLYVFGLDVLPPILTG